MSRIKQIVLSLVFMSLLVLGWQVAENIINTNRLINNETGLEAFIPSPVTILHTYEESGNLLLTQSTHTLIKAMVGFCLGFIVAIIMSFLFLSFPFLRKITLPILFGLNSFPIVGLAPAIVLAFGQGSYFSIIFLSALVCYFPTLITLDTALNNVDKDISDLMKVMGASNWQFIRYVRLPLSLPYLFLSMKLAIPGSIIGATMGEWLGSSNGIGQIITISLYQLKPGLLYASLFLIIIASLIGVLFVEVLEKHFVKWHI